ncbi:MAG: sulfatase-like hydrolase/transferase [Gammaproteobacteria bacterium]|nr:sulfatase-like hydrolase/transferase [Gammaproteobacteria bacterium]MBQ0841180.1 sulfatase-like hydrolase/transferase [Gammaproteobacteria bacterium]
MVGQHSSPARYLLLMLSSWLVIFLFIRTALLIYHLDEVAINLASLLQLYAVGLLYDLAFLAYAALPLGLYILLVPKRLWSRSGHQWWLQGLYAFSLFIMLFIAVCEWIFWDEFGVRFNFISVDYLVYSDEVLNNILQSYPIYPLLTGLTVIALLTAWFLRKQTECALSAPQLPWRQRPVGLVLLLAPALIASLLNQNLRQVDSNTYRRELSSNGPYQFFAAFRNNELDYPEFYATLPDAKVAQQLRAELAESNVKFIGEDPLDIRRLVDNPGEKRDLNVVLVTVESLSAKYLGSFGDPRKLTPNLDRLRQQSLFFNNFYATGTRTTRGLEAITLSIPPTPGRSIVKRVGRESGFASLGQQLNEHGYDSVFLYGGRGYFDNMNTFFRGNGYRVVDQDSVSQESIHFENAWGMSDEDLYDQVLWLADDDHNSGKPFFLQVMTTSNHRPYTYPEGRIDIPSGTGRAGAIKYTDYAIGRFLDAAQDKPWFGETIFVFVADHTAGSAGKEDLPIANYHIPLWIYAPAILPPREIDQLSSQIDLAPTLLGLLNIDYTSTFFGYNLLLANGPPGRALIGNYQHLGLFDGRDVAIIDPGGEVRIHSNAVASSRERKASSNAPLAARNITYYQGASYALNKKLLFWQQPSRHMTSNTVINEALVASVIGKNPQKESAL